MTTIITPELIQAMSQEELLELAKSMASPKKRCGGLSYILINGVQTPMYRINGRMVPPEIVAQDRDILNEYLKTAPLWETPKRDENVVKTMMTSERDDMIINKALGSLDGKQKLAEVMGEYIRERYQTVENVAMNNELKTADKDLFAQEDKRCFEALEKMTCNQRFNKELRDNEDRSVLKALDEAIDNEPSVTLIGGPPVNWLERLRRGHKIWLCKERETAIVEFPYEPPEPGYKTGRIGISRYNDIENRVLGIQSWFIDSNGLGIDGSPLMQPMIGNLPENPGPIPEPIVRQIERTLERLDRRITSIEHQIITKDIVGYDMQLNNRVTSLEMQND